MKTKDIPVVSIEKNAYRNYVVERISDEFFMVVQQGPVPDSAFNYPFRLDNLIVVMCREGQGELVVDFIRYEIKPNDLVLILPGSIVQLGEHSDDFFLYVIGASQSFISEKSMKSNIQLFLHIKDNPKVNLEQKEAEMLSAFIDFIHDKLVRVDHACRREIVQSLFLGFCYEITAVFQQKMDRNPQPQSRYEILFKDLMQLIVAHYKTERSVGFYAGKLCLTDKYLTRVIREVSGKTISEWIKIALIFDAKSQLKYTRKTIQEISNDLNFPNPSFFGKFFKQHTGMTPKAYRMS
ncbi:AraC family transcriptional regulator [Coprobacter sp.]